MTIKHIMRQNMTIKNIRQLKNITQCDVAIKLNCNQTSISKYEKGIAEPKIEQIPKLAKILDCSIEDIVKAIIETKEEKRCNLK